MPGPGTTSMAESRSRIGRRATPGATEPGGRLHLRERGYSAATRCRPTRDDESQDRFRRARMSDISSNSVSRTQLIGWEEKRAIAPYRLGGA